MKLQSGNNMMHTRSYEEAAEWEAFVLSTMENIPSNSWLFLESLGGLGPSPSFPFRGLIYLKAVSKKMVVQFFLLLSHCIFIDLQTKLKV